MSFCVKNAGMTYQRRGPKVLCVYARLDEELLGESRIYVVRMLLHAHKIAEEWLAVKLESGG